MFIYDRGIVSGGGAETQTAPSELRGESVTGAVSFVDGKIGRGITTR